MATRREQESLTASLRKWFSCHGYRVTDTELKVLTKNSRNAEFWRLVQRLALPGEEVRAIRERIAAHRRHEQYTTATSELRALGERKEELRAQIAACRSRTSQKTAALAAEKRRLKEVSVGKAERIREVGVRCARDVQQRHVNTSIAQLQTQLQTISGALCPSGQPSKEQAPPIISSDAVESRCFRAISTVLGQIYEYLAEHVGAEGEEPREELQEQVTAATLAILREHPVSEILESLVEVTRARARAVRERREKIDLEQELASVQFRRGVDGQLVSTEDGAAGRAEDEERRRGVQEAVTKQWLEMLKRRTEADKIAQSVKLLEADLFAGIEGTGEKRAEMVTQWRFQLRLVELRAKQEALGLELKRLQEDRIRLTKVKVETLRAHKSIVDFKKNQQEKQAVISDLVHQTNSLRTVLSGQTGTIQNFVQSSLLPAREQLLGRLVSARSYPGELVSLLGRLPLERLILTEDKDGPAHLQLLRESGLPLHLTGGALLSHLSNLLSAPLLLAPTDCAARDLLTRLQEGSPASEAVFDNLRAALTDFESFTAETVKDRIQRVEEKMTSVEKKIKAFPRMIETYVNQPGFLLLPWLTVDGLNLAQTLEKFRVREEERCRVMEVEKSAQGVEKSEEAEEGIELVEETEGLTISAS